MATFLAILTLVVTGQVLSPSTAFVVLSFMNLLRITLSLRLGNAIPLAFELFVSFQRIERFLLVNNMPMDPLEYDQSPCGQERTDKTEGNTYAEVLVRKALSKSSPSQRSISGNPSAVYGDEDVKQCKPPEKTDIHLSVSSVTCKLKENGTGYKFLLRDVSFQATEKCLTAITGQVGSGKSTLLAAIAGEVIKSSGDVSCSGTIAYVPQTAWVFPGTLRENVLFGEPYDERKYTEVIEACALKEDINRLPNGDLSFVGEHGVALSGGQRARVNLARAVYADADLYLLDDPLSAVDAKVSEHIFNQCICKLLKEKIILLATYSEKNMKAADQVVVLHKGSVLGKGSFCELKDGGKVFYSFTDASASTKEEKIKPREENETAYPDSRPVSFDEHLEISVEEKATGQISSTLYWDYFRAGMHPIGMIAVVVLFLVTQG